MKRFASLVLLFFALKFSIAEKAALAMEKISEDKEQKENEKTNLIKTYLQKTSQIINENTETPKKILDELNNFLTESSPNRDSLAIWSRSAKEVFADIFVELAIWDSVDGQLRVHGGHKFWGHCPCDVWHYQSIGSAFMGHLYDQCELEFRSDFEHQILARVKAQVQAEVKLILKNFVYAKDFDLEGYEPIPVFYTICANRLTSIFLYNSPEIIKIKEDLIKYINNIDEKILMNSLKEFKPKIDEKLATSGVLRRRSNGFKLIYQDEVD